MDSNRNNDTSHSAGTEINNETATMEELCNKSTEGFMNADASELTQISKLKQTNEGTVQIDEASVSQLVSTEDPLHTSVETSATMESSVDQSSKAVETIAQTIKNIEGDVMSITENEHGIAPIRDDPDCDKIVSNASHSLEDQSAKDISMQDQSAKDNSVVNPSAAVEEFPSDISMEEQAAKDNSVIRQTTTDTSVESSEDVSLINHNEAQVEIASNVSEMSTTLNQTEFEVHTGKPAQSGLSLLAQYDSDIDDNNTDNDVEKISDTDSVVEVPVNTINDYRNQTVEINSDSESDSSSDSSSDVEYLNEIRKAIDKSIDVDVDEDDDDENGGKGKRQPPRVKGEFLIDDLPPIQDLHITVPEEECVELGKVHSIVDQLVLVNTLPDSVLLDLDTVLFLDKGKRVLGEVFDVLGQVADPLYCVRFNSNKQIKEKNINVGDVVFVAPKTQYTQFVILSSLMNMRGSDASWENDIEPPPRYLDYSDDEQEKEARARLRNKDRPTDHNDPMKRARADSERPTTSHSQSSASVSPSPRQPFNNPNRGRGGYRPQRYNQRPHSQGYQNHNYNAGSWHSNYPQRFQGPPSHFGPPPQAYPNMMHPPPNFAAYPQHGVPMQPYPQQPPQHQQPMYVLNPYAIRPSVLPPSGQPYSSNHPPPPPGAQ